MSPGLLSKMGERFIQCLGLVVLLGSLSLGVPACWGENAEGSGSSQVPTALDGMSGKAVPRKINAIDVDPNRAVFETDGMIEKVRYFPLVKPERLVLDLYDAKPVFKEQQFRLEGGFRNLRIGSYSDKTRFVFDASGDKLPSYDVKKLANSIVVSWEGGMDAPPETSSFEPETSDVSKPAVVAPSESGARTVEAMDFLVENGKSLFKVTLSRPGELIPLKKIGNIVRFGVKNAHLPQHLRRSFDCSSFPSGVRMISPYTVVRGVSEEVRFAAELKGKVPTKLSQSGRTVLFEVENGPYADQGVGADDIDIKTVPVSAVAEPNSLTSSPHPIEVAEGMADQKGGEEADSISEDFAAKKKDLRYTGTKVSLVFDDADIRRIFQLLGEVSGYNLILGEEVRGIITLRLIDVPWDQAFDLVMSMKELGKIQEGNVIRILPRAKIAQMEEARLTAARTKEKLDDLVTEIISVSHIAIGKSGGKSGATKGGGVDIASEVKKLMTDRGKLTVDARNKQLIIMDVPSVIEEVKRLVKSLDTPTRQVMIEARIVEVSDTFSYDLGVKWGILNSRGEAASSVSFGGDFVIPPRGVIDGNYAGIGSLFQYAGLNSTLIDMRLSALEASGEARIISKPRVVTITGEKATMLQGQSIPYQTISENGVTKIEFIDANLEIAVTPEINPDGSVILDVEVSNNQPSTTLSVALVPAIDKKEAHTKVLVMDSETTVIGGVFVEQETVRISGVPLLMNIPMLKHLFQTTSKTTSRAELLIFITPKILI